MTFIDFIWFVLGVPVGLFLGSRLASVWTDNKLVLLISMIIGGLASGLSFFIGSAAVRAWIQNVRHKRKQNPERTTPLPEKSEH